MNHHNFIYDGKELFCFGFNADGALGLGDNLDRKTPTLCTTSKSYYIIYETDKSNINKNETIHQIACGKSHTLILKKTGELFIFGCNIRAQLGLGDRENRNIPILLMTDKEIQQIICGWDYTFILKKSGEIFAFGHNLYGELGFDSALQGQNNNSYIIHTPTRLDLQLYGRGEIYTLITTEDQKIRYIVCGISHTFVLKNSGELFAFGHNKYGQLGLGDFQNRNKLTLLMMDKNINQIICGGDHTFILKESGDYLLLVTTDLVN